jgi:hypothetical protein
VRHVGLLFTSLRKMHGQQNIKIKFRENPSRVSRAVYMLIIIAQISILHLHLVCQSQDTVPTTSNHISKISNTHLLCSTVRHTTAEI